jgi:hypothetical protein
MAKEIPDVVVVHQRDGKLSNPEPGLKRRALAYNDKLFLAERSQIVDGGAEPRGSSGNERKQWQAS